MILPLLLQLSWAIIVNHRIRIEVGGDINAESKTANTKVNRQVISLNVSDRISQADRKSSGKTILKQSQASMITNLDELSADGLCPDL